MFESDDWIFEDAFYDIGGENEEETRKSYSPCQNEEETSIKRRKVDNGQALTDSIFVRKSELNTIANIRDNDLSFKNKNYQVSRGDLLGIFQKNTQETFDSAKDITKDPSRRDGQRETQCFQSEMGATSKVSRYKESQRRKNQDAVTKVRLDKKGKLIRIFPGPAGLISNAKNDNISVAYCLNIAEELQNKTSIKHIEIKSQDEKNLCEEKAWKLLSNDLPDNFLQDYKISIVKDRANASHCDSMKVRFIGGVLDYIDHSYDDPFVILKDSTGSIEGTIHHDIPLTYPGVLEPNIVILLHDVGLLKTTRYVVTNKYHILVSLVNLLAIYSDKGRIISTPLMKNIISHTSNNELNKIDNCMPTVLKKPVYTFGLQKKMNENKTLLQASSCSDDSLTKNHELAKNLLHPTNEKYESTCEEIFENENKNCKVTNEIPRCLNDSMNTNDLDVNIFFATDDCTDFTTSEDQNCLNHLLSESIVQTNKIQQSDSQVQNIKHLENTKKESMIICRKRQIKESCNDTTCENLNLNVKSILPSVKYNVENSRTLISYFTDNKCTDEYIYDSDDEILSQLDVDNIFDKRKKEC